MNIKLLMDQIINVTQLIINQSGLIILYDGQILTNSYAFIYIEIQIRWSSLEYYSLNWWKTLVINFLIKKKNLMIN